MSAMTAAQKNAILASSQAGILDTNLLDAILGAPITVPATSKTGNSAASRKAAARKATMPKAENHNAPKAERTQSVAPKAAKPARKAAKPQTATSKWEDRPMSAKQKARITAVSNEHGFVLIDMSKWTAGVASTYYNDLKAAI